MHATTAPVPGSGKSYIIDLASAINSGERAPVLTAGRNEEETEKRLVAALLSGQTIISIDNVNGQLGGDALCQIIERPVVAVRPLGQSTFTKVESRASCFATGNNIQLVGDMTRRVLLCSLDPDVERPELRVFHSNPFDAVLADRGKYVAAALIDRARLRRRRLSRRVAAARFIRGLEPHGAVSARLAGPSRPLRHHEQGARRGSQSRRR
jgi:putative DNA primase/helicase